MTWLLIVTFHVNAGAVPMKLGPFVDVAACQAVARQMAPLEPLAMACVMVPKGVR